MGNHVKENQNPLIIFFLKTVLPKKKKKSYCADVRLPHLY